MGCAGLGRVARPRSVSGSSRSSLPSREEGFCACPYWLLEPPPSPVASHSLPSGPTRPARRCGCSPAGARSQQQPPARRVRDVRVRRAPVLPDLDLAERAPRRQIDVEAPRGRVVGREGRRQQPTLVGLGLHDRGQSRNGVLCTSPSTITRIAPAARSRTRATAPKRVRRPTSQRERPERDEPGSARGRRDHGEDQHHSEARGAQHPGHPFTRATRATVRTLPAASTARTRKLTRSEARRRSARRTARVPRAVSLRAPRAASQSPACARSSGTSPRL